MKTILKVAKGVTLALLLLMPVLSATAAHADYADLVKKGRPPIIQPDEAAML